MSGKVEVTDEIELKNGASNPFGWSQHEVWHDGQRIGWIESGSPSDFKAPYSFTLEPEGKNTRLHIWREPQADDAWDEAAARLSA